MSTHYVFLVYSLVMSIVQIFCPSYVRSPLLRNKRAVPTYKCASAKTLEFSHVGIVKYTKN